MPNGPTHRKLTYGLLTLSLPLIVFNPLIGVSFCLGVLVTRDINPDLDLHVPWHLKLLGYDLYKYYISHRKGLRRKDWKMKHWWETLTFSHLPYGGTILRLIPLLILWLIAAYTFTISPYITWVVALAFFNGMGLSDTIHVLADLIVSEVHQWT